MDILPARGGCVVALIGLLLSVASDAMAYAIEPTELFDVEVDQISGLLVFVASMWFGLLKVFETG